MSHQRQQRRREKKPEPVRIRECPAYELCQYKGYVCDDCLKMDVKSWKYRVLSILQVVRA